MTRITIKELVWDDTNVEHIKKHDVVPTEVGEAVSRFLAHKHGYQGRYVLIGRSGRRILAIIVKRENKGIYRVITARDADKKERGLLYEKES